MIVRFGEKEFVCDRAIKSEEKATLYLSNGETVEFSGISEEGWNYFQLDGGDWDTPEPTELERLRADIDFLSVMTGVVL